MHVQHYHPYAEESSGSHYFIIFRKAEPIAPSLLDSTILICLWAPPWMSSGLQNFSSLPHGQKGMKRVQDRDDRKLVIPNGRSYSSSEGTDSFEPSCCSTLFHSISPRSCLVPGDSKINKQIHKWESQIVVHCINLNKFTQPEPWSAPTRDCVVQDKTEKASDEHVSGQKYVKHLVQLLDTCNYMSRGRETKMCEVATFIVWRANRVDSTCLNRTGILHHPVRDDQCREHGKTKDKYVPRGIHICGL